MKKYTSAIILICYTIVCFAQNNAAKKINFHSLNQIGLLEGEQGSAFQLQTINGIQYKTWFGGLGVGLDYYSFRTIPVFIDVRKKLLNKAKSPFIYADGGVNYYWKNSSADYTWYTSEYKSGLYYDIGIGYTVSTKNNSAFVLSAGYSQKRFSEIRHNPVPIDFWPTPVTNITKLDYQFKRISIKVGWMF